MALGQKSLEATDLVHWANNETAAIEIIPTTHQKENRLKPQL